MIDFEQSVIQRSHQVPVLVDFSAEWCGPCKVIKPLLKTMSENATWDLAIVDVDNNMEVSIQYGIRSVPTILLFVDGVVQGSYRGRFSKAHLESWINSFEKGDS